MNQRTARALIAALSGGTLVWLLQRHRSNVFGHLPGLVEETIVLPMGDFIRDARSSRPDAAAALEERMTRKVGRNRKISVGGKLYGPLDAALVGEQVEVEERDGRIVVWSHGAETAAFELQQ